MDTQANGVGSLTGSLTVFELVWAQGVGAATGTLDLSAAPVAGFEIPYLLGLGGVTSISLVSTVNGRALVIGTLRQINQLRATPVGVGAITGTLTVTGSQRLAGRSNGVGRLIGELFVNGTRNLAGTSNGVATVTVSLTHLIGGLDVDPRSQTYMYFFLNVGVGFDPTDDATGHIDFVSQNFPDGHTRDDFWEYLYVFVNVGVGFDPTDDASGRPDFVSQTFPDGHTRDDFWEYLYLYLNVVRGFKQQGQLVIRPGFTRGPILPGAKPPKQVPV